jgi:hypothetical protein
MSEELSKLEAQNTFLCLQEPETNKQKTPGMWIKGEVVVVERQNRPTINSRQRPGKIKEY